MWHLLVRIETDTIERHVNNLFIQCYILKSKPTLIDLHYPCRGTSTSDSISGSTMYYKFHFLFVIFMNLKSIIKSPWHALCMVGKCPYTVDLCLHGECQVIYHNKYTVTHKQEELLEHKWREMVQNGMSLHRHR